MPIYEYTCKSCGREFEELIRGDQQPACPACGKGDVEKQMSAPAGHVASVGGSACPSRDMCANAHRCGANCSH
jgi:putative FmdB family regulatory protein